MALGEEQAGTNYTVLARRYRPSRFEDCVGQQHVAQALRNAIQTGRVAHAYLFCGSRGVGKTSMARIFAKALNCIDGPTTNPCGVCESCLAIAAGSDLDVIEIDGASNRGIEEIRELRQGVAYRPSRSRYKIYIIDEVHMLTKEAFNALLKTLEEPPAHVKFIFATTEAQKIPITILSRCQRYDFAGIGLDQIAQRLAEIVQAEGMTAEPEAVELIARRARGSMRDSQSLLDQVLAFAGGELTAQKVHQLLGTAGEERVLALAEAILTQDAPHCLRLVDSAVAEGVQLGEWVEQTLDYFRDLMVLNVDPQAGILSMPSRLRDQLVRQATHLTAERILEMMDILASCRSRLRATSFGRTLLEMTLVRLCRLDQFLSLADAISSPPEGMVDQTPSQPSPQWTAQQTSASFSVSDALAQQAKKNGSDYVTPPSPAAEPRPSSFNKSTLAINGASSTPAISIPDTLSPPPSSLSADLIPFTQETCKKVWAKALASLEDPILEATFSQGEPTFERPLTLVLKFSASAGPSKKRCEDKIDVVRTLLQSITGQPVSVRCDQLDASAEAAKPTTRSQLQLRDEAAKDPIVLKAEELLGAKIFGEITLIQSAPAVVSTIVEPIEDDSDKS